MLLCELLNETAKRKNLRPKQGAKVELRGTTLFHSAGNTGRIFMPRYAGFRLWLLFVHRSSSKASSSALLPVRTNHRLSRKRVEITTPYHSL